MTMAMITKSIHNQTKQNKYCIFYKDPAQYKKVKQTPKDEQNVFFVNFTDEAYITAEQIHIQCSMLCKIKLTKKVTCL